MAIIERPIGGIIQRPAKIDWVDKLATVSPEQLEKEGKWVQAGVQQTGKDLLAIPGHFFNQFGYNYPRYQTEKAGMEYPTETESPVANVLAHGAGVAGAILSPVNKIAMLRALRPVAGVAKTAPLIAKAGSSAVNILKNAAIGAGASGLYASDMEEKPGRMATGAFLGGAIPAAGGTLLRTAKGIPVAGRAIARSLGGINDVAINIGKSIGWKKVFDPLKSAPDYLSKVVVPRVREKLVNTFQNIANTPQAKQALTNLGYRVDEVKQLVNLTKPTLKWFADNVKKGMSPAESIDAINTKVHTLYNDFINSRRNVQIPVKGTAVLLKNALIRTGWMDATGNLKLTSITGKQGVNPTQQAVHNLYLQLREIGNGKIDGATYLNYLDELKNLMKTDPTKMRIVVPVINSLRRKAEQAVPGLSVLNKFYADTFILDNMANKLEKTYSTDGVMKLITEMSPNSKVFDWNIHHRAKQVLGKDLYDDVMSNYLQEIFAAKGYPSPSGVREIAIKKAAQGYYKSVAPGIEKIKQSKAVTTLDRLYKKYMASAEETQAAIGKIKPGLTVEDVSGKQPLGKGLGDWLAQKQSNAYKNDASYRKFVDSQIAKYSKGGGPVEGSPFRK